MGALCAEADRTLESKKMDRTALKSVDDGRPFGRDKLIIRAGEDAGIAPKLQKKEVSEGCVARSCPYLAHFMRGKGLKLGAECI